VFDDVLEDETFAAISSELDAQTYRPAHKNENGLDAWAGGGQDPLRGVPIWASASRAGWANASFDRLRRTGVVRVWPTGGPLDIALARVRALTKELPVPLDKEGEAWLGLIATPFKYGVGQDRLALRRSTVVAPSFSMDTPRER
jgi:hypothetical protein